MFDLSSNTLLSHYCVRRLEGGGKKWRSEGALSSAGPFLKERKGERWELGMRKAGAKRSGDQWVLGKLHSWQLSNRVAERLWEYGKRRIFRKGELQHSSTRHGAPCSDLLGHFSVTVSEQNLSAVCLLALWHGLCYAEEQNKWVQGPSPWAAFPAKHKDVHDGSQQQSRKR